LAENWPGRFAFDDLLSRAESRLQESGLFDPKAGQPSPSHKAVLSEVLLAGCTAEILDLHVSPGAFVTDISERPAASPLARLQASEGGRITTLRHTHFNPDQLTLHLLPLLDGKTERADLIKAITEIAEEEEIGFQENGQPVTDPERFKEIVALQVDAKLEDLARSGLLES
jgi:hypothetical protein